jgi:hypothetical protein
MAVDVELHISWNWIIGFLVLLAVLIPYSTLVGYVNRIIARRPHRIGNDMDLMATIAQTHDAFSNWTGEAEWPPAGEAGAKAWKAALGQTPDPIEVAVRVQWRTDPIDSFSALIPKVYARNFASELMKDERVIAVWFATDAGVLRWEAK